MVNICKALKLAQFNSIARLAVLICMCCDKFNCGTNSDEKHTLACVYLHGYELHFEKQRDNQTNCVQFSSSHNHQLKF